MCCICCPCRFSDKTKNDWDFRFMFEKVPGKYDLLKMDYSKGTDTPDTGAAVKKEKEKVMLCRWCLDTHLYLICCYILIFVFPFFQSFSHHVRIVSSSKASSLSSYSIFHSPPPPPLDLSRVSVIRRNVRK